MTRPPRVGLLEITATGRFFHCGLFPWLQGLLGAGEAPGQWWRVEVPPDQRFGSGEQGVALGPEADFFVRYDVALDDLGPTHLLMILEPAPSLAAAILQAHPEVEVAVLDPGAAAALPAGVRGLTATVEAAAVFLGLDPT